MNTRQKLHRAANKILKDQKTIGIHNGLCCELGRTLSRRIGNFLGRRQLGRHWWTAWANDSANARAFAIALFLEAEKDVIEWPH